MSDKITVGERVDKAGDKVSKKADKTRDKIATPFVLDPKLDDANVRFAIFRQNEGMCDEDEAFLDKGLPVVPDDKVLLMIHKDAVDIAHDILKSAKKAVK